MISGQSFSTLVLCNTKPEIQILNGLSYGSGENSLRISTWIQLEVEFESENQTTSDFVMKNKFSYFPLAFYSVINCVGTNYNMPFILEHSVAEILAKKFDAVKYFFDMT